ncbi:MAG: radical SAM protein [Candidatus Auribacterota bacterium]|nr:radical SAM protein [Candidatus Auribacterota bacterium]
MKTDVKYTLNEIKLELTYRCLLKCIHCSSDSCSSDMPELSYKDAMRIVHQAIDMNVKKIALSGGEPLLWPNLEKLIAVCKKAQMTVIVYTSGIASNNLTIIKTLKESGLDKIIFSLYATTSEIHDAITLVNKSYHQTLEAINYSISLGLKTELHFVPMSSNYTELPELIELAKRLGISQLSILRIVPQGRSKENQNTILSHSQTKELEKLVKSNVTQDIDIRIGSPYSILLCTNSPDCMAGIDRLTISPDLTIAPCDAFKQVKSINIAGTNFYSKLDNCSLQECWINSPYLNRIREFIEEPLNAKCSSCDNLKICHSGCIAQKYLLNGKLISSPDPLCAHIRECYS